MAEERAWERELAWRESAPVFLLKTVRLSRQWSKLLLGAFGLVATTVGWRVAAAVFSGDPATREAVDTLTPWPWAAPSRAASAPGLAATSHWLVEQLGLGTVLGPRELEWLFRNPVVDTWELVSRPLWHLFDAGDGISATALFLVSALWSVAVWGVVGGALSRIAAIQLCREERLTLVEGWTFARKKWLDYLWAPLLPLVLVVGLVAVVSLGGWLARFDWGLLVLAVGFPLILAAGLAMAIVCLGWVLGWPLMWATISVEGTDHFDGISRAYAYTLQRPLRFLGYAATAVFYGLLGWLLVASLAAAAVYLGIWALSWTVGAERMAAWSAEVPAEVALVGWPKLAAPSAEIESAAGADSANTPAAVAGSPAAAGSPTKPTDSAAAATDSAAAGAAATGAGPAGAALSPPGRWGVMLVSFWVGVVKLLALGFGPAYFWTATTGVYLLLRRETDHTEIDEVFLEDRPEPLGLPKLATDAAGVPGLAGEPAAPPAGELTEAQLNSTALVEPQSPPPPRRDQESALTGSAFAAEDRHEDDGG